MWDIFPYYDGDRHDRPNWHDQAALWFLLVVLPPLLVLSTRCWRPAVLVVIWPVLKTWQLAVDIRGLTLRRPQARPETETGLAAEGHPAHLAQTGRLTVAETDTADPRPHPPYAEIGTRYGRRPRRPRQPLRQTNE